MSQIKFNKGTYVMGRNGISQCKGLDIYPTTRLSFDNTEYLIIIITPVNSKGDLTNCWIEIDATVIPDLIKDLQYFYDNFRKNSKVQGASGNKPK